MIALETQKLHCLWVCAAVMHLWQKKVDNLSSFILQRGKKTVSYILRKTMQELLRLHTQFSPFCTNIIAQLCIMNEPFW